MGVAERRQREKHQRRCRILDAAERVFLKQGLGAATMDQVAREAELSKGTLYLYFKSKDELWLQVANRALEELVTLLKRSAAAGGSGLWRLERLLIAYAEFMRGHRERFRMATSWLLDDYIVSGSPAFERYRELIGAVFATVSQAVDLGKQDGSIRTALPTLELVVQLWGGLLGVLMVESSSAEVARRLPGPVDFAALVPAYVQLLLGGVAGLADAGPAADA